MSVSWLFIEGVLTHIGLSGPALLCILALYSCPIDRVKVNGVLSDSFTIGNGTRQGCPLSPLIFSLSLEPFLRRFWKLQYIPTLADWLRELTHIREMEELTLSIQDREQTFWETWSVWLQVQKSPEYAQALGPRNAGPPCLPSPLPSSLPPSLSFPPSLSPPFF